MKILLCFGTRPEAIKMAPVIKEIKDKGLDHTICVTAQHREMLDQVLEFFDIIPDYDLDLMRPGQNLNSLSSLILEKLDQILMKEAPDIILVQGDTTSAFLASFAAFNRGIKIGHVEAGLRTYNLQSPFPEEANRQLIGRIADLHFAPTDIAKKNLESELKNGSRIFLTGNTVLDALRIGRDKIDDDFTTNEINQFKEFLKSDHNLILVTGHRRESFGKGLEEICEALREIANKGNTQIIFPVHMNPRVLEAVERILGKHPKILLSKPINYPAFIWLMSQCDLIISDSGGIQEEAPSFQKPVIVTRDNTERPEGVEAGFCFLAGTSRTKIIGEVLKLLKNPPNYQGIVSPYGDGMASIRIVEQLQNLL